MHNFNERIVYDIITEHQSTEHKYNIETSFNNLNFNFGISNDINNINIKIAELHMHEILSRFEDLKALCPDWPCFLYKKKFYGRNIVIVTMSFTLKKIYRRQSNCHKKYSKWWSCDTVLWRCVKIF